MTVNTINTSLNQVPALVRRVVKRDLVCEREGLTILNFGCGRYWKRVSAYLCNELGERPAIVAYDPNLTFEGAFNAFEEYHSQFSTLVTNRFFNAAYDVVIAANVLNVIADDVALVAALEELKRAVVRGKSGGCRVFISVYEGDKSGVGRETSRGYQRNMRLKEYLPFVFDVFGEPEGFKIVAKNGVISIF